MAHILVTDPLASAGIALLENAGHSVQQCSIDEANVAEAEAWIVRSGTTLDADTMARAPKLRAIGRAGVGVDNIDLEAATKQGVAVFNAPTGNITSACEQAWALMLAAARHIPAADVGMKQETWLRKQLKGTELAGKTLFVIGLGKIGRMMAKRAIAFDMQVIGFDPFVTAEAAKGFGVELVDLPTGFGRAQVISLHTPLVESTRDIICQKHLDLCPDGVMLINAARGPLVDEAALLDALESGKVLAAGLDVWNQEPPTNWALAKHPRVVAAPHLGASTKEAQDKAAVQAVQQVIACLETGDMSGALNAQSGVDDTHAPWAQLAKQLTSFALQLSHNVDGIEIATTPNLQPELLQHSALLGAALSISEHANPVNAPVLAKEQGWSVATRTLPEDDDTYLRITVQGTTQVLMEATWSPHYGSRITNIQGFDVEFRPKGRFLVTFHDDVPGVLASITRTLADANVNVAGVSLARRDGKAIAVIRVDGGIPRAAREALRDIDAIAEAHRVRLIP